MTISSTTRVAGPFTGNGTASAFPFSWKVFAAADLDVVRRDVTSGIDTVLVLNTDYTVALNGNQNTNPGGTVTLTAGALASGFTLTLTSDLANLQPTDLTNQGGFYPEVINDSLDRATIQIQQLAGEVSRSIRAPLADGSPAMVLPPSDVRSNGFLAFDGNGLPTIQAAASGAAPTSITRQVFSGTGSQTVFNLSTDPGGAGNSAQVFIGGVYQQRNTYTINGTVLTFSQAPVAGTNNIEFVNFLIGSGANGVGIVTLTGDVTGSGTGTVPATIAADAVTFAKMQNIATDRLLGRDTAGTGDIEQLTVSGGIEFTGTGIRTSAFTGDVTKAAGGVATTIASGAVTPAKLSTGAPSWDSSSNLTVGGDLTVTGTMQLPAGTTAQRPSNPTAGMVRHNTTTGKLEHYNGTAWQTFAPETLEVEYLVVAGGGGGSSHVGSLIGGDGGGGAGGYRTNVGSTPLSLAANAAYTVTVGAGGAAGLTSASGSNSVFSTITSAGGGAGGISEAAGTSGGSGGGGSGATSATPAAGGSGNTPSASPSQGNNGGAGSASGGAYAGGGGGGAGAVGGDATSGANAAAGAGGAGTANSITGASVTYAGGGGGGVLATGTGTEGAGGAGGGGAGGKGVNAVSGTANTGSGGGSTGGANTTGGNGGSGIVIVRYLGGQRATGGTVTSSGGYTIHSFTSSGTFTVDS